MTDRQPHIVGFSGSLRQNSFNRSLLLESAKFLPPHYAFTMADISDIPLYNQDLEHTVPPAVQELARLVKSADGILFSTPEYNFSIPGVLKNPLDWLSRQFVGTPLAQKPAAIMGAATGLYGTVRAQMHLRDILFGLNMVPITRPEVLIGQANLKFDSLGTLTDEPAKGFLKQLVDHFVSAVEMHLK